MHESSIKTIIVLLRFIRGETNMEHWLVQQAKQQPRKIAIETPTESLTFEELLQLATEKGAALKALNRQRLGLYIDNTIESVVLLHAAWLYQIEISLINNRLTAYEIDQQMNAIGIDLIISTQNILFTTKTKVIYSSTLFSEEAPHIHHSVSENQIASIMFTSGTTGPQKAVPQTFANHQFSAESCIESLGFSPSSKWLAVLPLFHISGLSILLRSVQYGFTVYLLEKFDERIILEAIQYKGITHISLVPVTLMRLMQNGLNQPYQLEKILLGGAKLDEQLIRQALQYQLPIYNSFGMTETCSQFLTASPQLLKNKPNTVGHASENIDLKVVYPDENGHGELYVKAQNVMNGYLYPSHLENAFDAEGYFKTGDIASMDEDGDVIIYDRRKDLIISGGENIYPFEIESVAKTHPEVQDAMCTGIDDDVWGQRPILYVVAQQAIENIEGYLQARLARYKQPAFIYFVKALPYTSTGKLQRRLLNEGFQ